MELIPILATIVLVATISTFILAIGAYLLYKIREGRGQQVEVIQPSTIQAELITPESIYEQAAAQEPMRAPGQIVPEQPRAPQYRPSAEPVFVQQRANTPQPMQQRYTPPPQPYNPPKQEKVRGAQGPAVQTTEQKFMKYTSEGYVPAKENKNGGALKWR